MKLIQILIFLYYKQDTDTTIVKIINNKEYERR